MIVMGLDISTAVTGVAFYESLTKTILKLDHIEFKDCKSVWEKADKVRDYFKTIEYDVGFLAIEEIAMMYGQGMSSAGTITTLARFNGLVSYLARDRFKIEPVHMTPAAARKACGLKMLQKQKHPRKLSHKEQCFVTMCATDLKHVVWPTKKNGQIVDWARDECDAYVIARGAANLFVK